MYVLCLYYCRSIPDTHDYCSVILPFSRRPGVTEVFWASVKAGFSTVLIIDWWRCNVHLCLKLLLYYSIWRNVLFSRVIVRSCLDSLRAASKNRAKSICLTIFNEWLIPWHEGLCLTQNFWPSNIKNVCPAFLMLLFQASQPCRPVE